MRCCSPRSGCFSSPPPTRRCRCAPRANGRRRQGKVVVSKTEAAQGQGDRQRPGERGTASRSATSPTSSTNIPSRAASCATTASASARTAAISRSPRPSRNIRSAPSSPSITIRCIRTRRCWSATCRKACGAASASARRSCWRSCSARRSACIRLTEFASSASRRIPKCRRWSSPSSAFGFLIALFGLALQQAGIAGEEMAGRDRHHQAVGP